MNFIKNIKGVNTLYNLRLVNPSISINGNLIPATYTQPLYNSNSNLYLNFNTNNFNSSGGTLNLNENQTFNNLITTTITTTNLQVIQDIYSDELHSNNVYASVANIENIISTKTYFENILQPLSFDTSDNLQVKYDDITIGLNAENELRVDFNGNIATRPYHPITSSKLADLIGVFPFLPDAAAVANFLGIPQAVYLETDFIGLRIEDDHFSFSNSINAAKLQLAQNIVAMDSNLTIGNIWADTQIKSLYLIAEASATLGNIRCDNINSSGEGTLGSLDVVSMTIQDLNCEGTITANNLIATTTTLGNTRITDDLLVSADSTMGNMNVLEMNIQTLVAEGDTTLNNLQVASTTADYIEGDDLFYTNGTITNLQITSTTSDYIEGDDLYYTTGTITNLIMGNIGDGLRYTGGTPNKLTLDLDNGLYITNTNKVGVKKGPGLKFNPDASGQLEVNLSETGGLSFYTDKITINAGTGLQITGNNLRVSETQSTLNITTSDISSANLINATISNIAGSIAGQGLTIEGGKLKPVAGRGLKIIEEVSGVSGYGIFLNLEPALDGRIEIGNGTGTTKTIGIQGAFKGTVDEIQRYMTTSTGIPLRLETYASSLFLIQAGELATATLLFDYFVSNIPLRQRDTCLLGVIDMAVALTAWQATATAELAYAKGNVDVLKNIVDNRNGTGDAFLNTADVVAVGSNSLMINTSKSSIYIPTLTCENLMIKNSFNATASNIQCYALTSTTDISSNNLVVVNHTCQVLHTSVSNVIGLTATNANLVNITSISNAKISDTTILNMRATNTTMTSITALSSNTDTATITNGTLVNSSISNLRGTNTTLTNISTVNADINNTTITNGNMVNTTITNIQSTNTTNTNLRSTNTTLTNIQSTDITSSTMRATDVISTNTTSVNTRASFANIINSILQSSSITNLLSSNANLLTITSPNVLITNANLVNTTSTNIVATNLTSSTALISSANLLSITSPNVVITNANLVNTTSTNIQSTNITTNTILITNANIVNATIQNFNTTNTFTDITTTNMLCSNANLVNTTSTNIRATDITTNTILITNANIVNATIQNFNTTNTFTDITTTNMLCSNANLVNTTSTNIRATNISTNNMSVSGGNIRFDKINTGLEYNNLMNLTMDGNTVNIYPTNLSSATIWGFEFGNQSWSDTYPAIRAVNGLNRLSLRSGDFEIRQGQTTASYMILTGRDTQKQGIRIEDSTSGGYPDTRTTKWDIYKPTSPNTELRFNNGSADKIVFTSDGDVALNRVFTQIGSFSLTGSYTTLQTLTTGGAYQISCISSGGLYGVFIVYPNPANVVEYISGGSNGSAGGIQCQLSGNNVQLRSYDSSSYTIDYSILRML